MKFCWFIWFSTMYILKNTYLKGTKEKNGVVKMRQNKKTEKEM